jgi:aspartokinase-like uncharacterized kinase
MLRRVIKVGGSCLSDPDFAAKLSSMVKPPPADQRPAQNFCVVGGGEAIEAMRRLDRLHGLDAAAMHWRCVRLLRASLEIAAELVPQWPVIAEPAALERLIAASPRPGCWWIAVDSFYRPETSVQSGLPEHWDTTTDAIAAYLARRTAADQLVLIKSCRVPTQEPRELARRGVVDPALPAALPEGIAFSVRQLGTVGPRV